MSDRMPGRKNYSTRKRYEFPEGSGTLYNHDQLQHLCKVNKLRHAGVSAKDFLKRLIKFLAKGNDVILTGVQGEKFKSYPLSSDITGDGLYYTTTIVKRHGLNHYEFPKGSGKDYNRKGLQHLCKINNLPHAWASAQAYLQRLNKHLAKPTTTFIAGRIIKIKRKKKTAEASVASQAEASVASQATQLFRDAMIPIGIADP